MSSSAVRQHSVEKIGGTSMTNYLAVRDNIVLRPANTTGLYQRIFVVSAYGGVTDELLENKKTGKPGVYGLFANSKKGDESWQEALRAIRERLHNINRELFSDDTSLLRANQFIDERLDATEDCLNSLQAICGHGHFSLSGHLATVREMLASIGEAHSAWNLAALLQQDNVNARFVDLTGWQAADHVSLDERILMECNDLDLDTQLPIVTGYAHAADGLMRTLNRGYSEMTFSRIAVLTQAVEAVIHKEFHLSSADPRLVGEQNAIPIGRTNYDVADQLSNLGVEAIHPKAAKGLRQNAIPLRIRNTFEPEHAGTAITQEYRSDSPCVEIIAGSKGIYVLELFDQNMVGDTSSYEQTVLELLQRFRVKVVAKDMNANTLTHYLSTNLKTLKRLRQALEEAYPDAEFTQRKVAIVSAIGSDMKVAGILAQAVSALSGEGISIQAMHQSMRQVNIEFFVDESDYERAVKALHRGLVEVHDHGRTICAA